MNLSELNAVPMKRQKRKRVGRGTASGLGKTAGRGQKGHQSRSGYSRRMGFEGGQMPLYRRLPKKGFGNGLFRVEYTIVNTGQLNIFPDGTEVDIAALKKAGLIIQAADLVKVLAKGGLSRRLTLKVHKFSEAAKQMIEAAGGTAQEIA